MRCCHRRVICYQIINCYGSFKKKDVLNSLWSFAMSLIRKILANKRLRFSPVTLLTLEIGDYAIHQWFPDPKLLGSKAVLGMHCTVVVRKVFTWIGKNQIRSISVRPESSVCETWWLFQTLSEAGLAEYDTGECAWAVCLICLERDWHLWKGWRVMTPTIKWNETHIKTIIKLESNEIRQIEWNKIFTSNNYIISKIVSIQNTSFCNWKKKKKIMYRSGII